MTAGRYYPGRYWGRPAGQRAGASDVTAQRRFCWWCFTAGMWAAWVLVAASAALVVAL